MIDTCRRSVADQLIVPPVCDRIHRSLTVHSRVWMLACLFWCTCEYGCCVFLSQVTLLHGVGVSTHSGIPGKSPKELLMLGMQVQSVSQSVSQQIYSTLIYHENLIHTPSHSMCVFVWFFFLSHAERQKLSLSCRNHCIFQVASSPLSQIKCITT